MDLCIKTMDNILRDGTQIDVSILVLMDLCIKTEEIYVDNVLIISFNPCFNGSMYKNNLFI